MKTYLIYFIDRTSDVNAQALNLEKQMSAGEYDLVESPEQKERNREIARHFEEKYEDLHAFHNPFGEEDSKALGIEWIDEESGNPLVLSDTQGMELKFIGNYLFIELPKIKTMWESDLVDRRVVEIISYCQQNYTVLAFDEEDKELLDEIANDPQI